jgi:hypothetical protein
MHAPVCACLSCHAERDKRLPAWLNFVTVSKVDPAVSIRYNELAMFNILDQTETSFEFYGKLSTGICRPTIIGRKLRKIKNVDKEFVDPCDCEIRAKAKKLVSQRYDSRDAEGDTNLPRV